MGLGSSKYDRPREVPTEWFPGFVDNLPSLSGRVVAITGCTTGTGYACAKGCLAKGARVVMLNRPSDRASGAEESLRRAFPGAQVETIACDLQSFASVKKAAEEMAAKLGEVGLDALVNNAGVMALADIATGDGYDVQMQTNHLSHFLLTREVWPLLEKAAEVRGEARVVNHSSLARMGKVLDARYLERNGGALGGNGNSMLFGGARWLRYHQTKLANVVFTLALADKVAAAGTSKIVVACAAPGLAATNLQVTTAADGGMKDTWIMRWAQSADDGAMPILHCLAAAGVQSGDFFEPPGMGAKGIPVNKRHKLSAECVHKESRALLWSCSEAACGPWSFGDTAPQTN